MEIEKHQLSTKREKRIKGKHSGHKNNYIGNLSDKWLRKGYLKRTIEALIMVAQEQAIRTNNIKAKIDKTQENSKYRMCGKAEESVNHVLSECSKLVQKEYKRQHDWFGTKIHWEICRKYGIELKEKWYEHKPEAVLENDKCKIL